MVKKQNEELKLQILKLEAEIKLLQENRLKRMGIACGSEPGLEHSLHNRVSIQSVNINNDNQMEQIIKDHPKTQESFLTKEYLMTNMPRQLHGSSISYSLDRRTSSVGGLSQSEQISHLIAQIRYQEQKINELQSKNTDLENRIKNVTEVEKELTKLKEANQQLTDKLKFAEHESLVSKDQNVQYQIDIEKYQDSMHFLQQKHEESQHRIAELGECLAESEQKLHQLQNALKSTADDVRAAVVEAYAQTQTSLEENDLIPQSDRSCDKKIKKENAQLTKKLEEARLQKKEYKNEVRSSRETIIRYKQELNAALKEKRELMKQIN